MSSVLELPTGHSRGIPAAVEPADYCAESLLGAQKQSLEMIVRGAPLGEVLSYLARVVEELADFRAVASILLLDEHGKLWTGAGPSLPEHYVRAINGLTASADLGTCSVAAATNAVVITADIEAEPKWASIKHLPLELGLKAAWSQPIVARDGRVLGTFGTYFRECREPSSLERRLVETLSHTASLAIERKQAEEALEQQRRILDMALEAADMGTWRYRLTDHVCVFSERAQRFYGAPERVVHDEEGVRRLLHPEDVSRMWRAVQDACDPSREGRYSADYRVRKANGEWRWLRAWGVTEFEGSGAARRAVAIVGASRDVTEQKEAERQRELLVDELSHRVKNNLAIVQSIAAQTLRSTSDPLAFKEAFSARLAALSRAHALLTKALWEGASLSELASVTLAPFGYGREPQVIQVDGPEVSINASAAVTLCLVLHELATNAAKHGSLSELHGRVELTWQRLAADANRPACLEIHWRERGGPHVVPPERRGFGSRLITASAEQFGGEVALEFKREGLEYRLQTPELLACAETVPASGG